MFNKRGQAVWLSFVLITAFAVAIGILVGTQIIQSSQRSAENIKEYVFDTEECNGVGISIENICQNPQALNIELSNIRNVRVDEVVLKIFDGSEDSETKNIAFSLEPGTKKSLNVGKSRIAGRVEVMPVVYVEDVVVTCKERTAEQDQIQDCE